jgi:hypothetical protein
MGISPEKLLEAASGGWPIPVVDPYHPGKDSVVMQNGGGLVIITQGSAHSISPEHAVENAVEYIRRLPQSITESGTNRKLKKMVE